MNIDILQGKTTEHLVLLEGTKCFIHNQMLMDFLRLQKDAQKEGFDLKIVSAFRDYDRQLKIWNLKASGERPLLDEYERPLEFSKLSPIEVILAILRWSALPGSSRHHWGSDIDVYDGKTQTEQEVKLIPSETIYPGPASRLHDWLDTKIATDSAYGFYRPYATDRGGVAPERWHLSYYPISRRYLESYTFSLFKKTIEESDMFLKETVLEHADEIFRRFFLNVDVP